MDPSINYPLGMKFYEDVPVISVYFRNNHIDPILVYDRDTERLLGVVCNGMKVHYHLPLTIKNIEFHYLEKFHRYAKIIEDMIYIVP